MQIFLTPILKFNHIRFRIIDSFYYSKFIPRFLILIHSIYLGTTKLINNIKPRMCQTDLAVFATLNSSTITSFHKSLPTNPRIIIDSKNASRYAKKST